MEVPQFVTILHPIFPLFPQIKVIEFSKASHMEVTVGQGRSWLVRSLLGCYHLAEEQLLALTLPVCPSLNNYYLKWSHLRNNKSIGSTTDP